jgi:hypothetical protein
MLSHPSFSSPLLNEDLPAGSQLVFTLKNRFFRHQASYSLLPAKPDGQADCVVSLCKYKVVGFNHPIFYALCPVGVAAIQRPAVLTHLHCEQRLNNNNFNHRIFYALSPVGVAAIQPPAVLTHLHCEQRLNNNSFNHPIFYALCTVGVAAVQPPAVLTHLHCEQRLNKKNFHYLIFYALCPVGVAAIQHLLCSLTSIVNSA